MINYEIAILSYKRPKIIKEKTLKLLSPSIPKDNIKIFIRDEDELEDYKNEIGNEYEFIINNAKGFGNCRNHLRKYYKNKELDLVLFIDDDIAKLEEYVDKKTLKPVENLEEVLDFIYNETKKRNLSFFGIPGFNNPYFMGQNISTNLKLLVGCFCGLIEPHKAKLLLCSTEHGHGEDYELSMKHFLEDGGVCRFNMFCISQNYYNTIGGMAEDMGGNEKRNLIAKESLSQLVNDYPKMCRLIQKKNKMWDLKLNFRFKLEEENKNVFL